MSSLFKENFLIVNLFCQKKHHPWWGKRAGAFLVKGNLPLVCCRVIWVFSTTHNSIPAASCCMKCNWQVHFPHCEIIHLFLVSKQTSIYQCSCYAWGSMEKEETPAYPPKFHRERKPVGKCCFLAIRIKY